MQTCSVCNKPSPIVSMCDMDEEGNQYCPDCFKLLGCHENHPEDCETRVYEDSKP